MWVGWHGMGWEKMHSGVGLGRGPMAADWLHLQALQADNSTARQQHDSRGNCRYMTVPAQHACYSPTSTPRPPSPQMRTLQVAMRRMLSLP